MPTPQYYRTPDGAAVYRCKLCGNDVVQNGGNWDDSENPVTWEDGGVCQGVPGGGTHVPW